MLTWFFVWIADAMGDALRNLMLSVLLRLPWWLLLAVAVIVALVVFGCVFVVWICSVYIYRGWIEFRKITEEMGGGFTFLVKAGFARLCELLLFIFHAPNNTLYLLVVMKESVLYVVRTSPGVVMHLLRNEYREFVRARNRLVGDGQQRARVLSPRRR